MLVQIDLHGRYPDEVGYYIDKAMIECKTKHELFLQIIYGRGEGIIKQAVMKCLSKYSKNIIKTEGNDVSVTIQLSFQPLIRSIYKRRMKGNVDENGRPEDQQYQKTIKEKRQKGREKYLKRIQREQLR